MNEGDIHITVTMPSAVSLERGAEVLRDMRLALLKFPEVKDVLSEQGHPEDGTDDEAPNQSETFVIMKPEADWPKCKPGQARKEQIVEAMRASLDPAGRRLQLQPADQGPRRGINLRYPRPGRREDLRRRPGPDAPEAGRGQDASRPSMLHLSARKRCPCSRLICVRPLSRCSVGQRRQRQRARRPIGISSRPTDAGVALRRRSAA